MGESAGKAVSPVELKTTVGRGVLRPSKHHQGQLSDPTAFEARRRLEARSQKKGPTELEMKLLFEESPAQVRVLRAAGIPDEQIYELLNS